MRRETGSDMVVGETGFLQISNPIARESGKFRQERL
jgi:hypothetical protein